MRLRKNRDTSVRAVQSEAYMMPKEAEACRRHSGQAWWSSTFVLIFITIGLAGFDAIVLFSVLDVALTQAAWMGIAASAGIALILNFLPLVIAGNMQNAIYHLERFALTKAIAGILVFLLLFSATVYVRFSYSDMYGNDSQTAALVNNVGGLTEDNEGASENSTNHKSSSMVTLLSIEPLATSVLAFLLAFFNDNPLKSKIDYYRQRHLELEEAHSDLLAAMSNMDCDEELLLKLDEERYIAAQTLIHARCDELRAQARFLLSEHLREPPAISRLSESAVDLASQPDESINFLHQMLPPGSAGTTA